MYIGPAPPSPGGDEHRKRVDELAEDLKKKYRHRELTRATLLCDCRRKTWEEKYGKWLYGKDAVGGSFEK
jgi:hypothetical protein